MKKQKKLDLEVETVGKPSIEALPEAEQRVFYETLLKRIQELATKDEKRKNEIDNHIDKIK